MTFLIIAATVIVAIIGLGLVDGMLDKGKRGASGDVGYEILEKLVAVALIGLIWWLLR